MNSSRIARAAALASAIFWSAKAIAIGIAGGLDRTPLEEPLFLLGLLFAVVACIAYGVAVTEGRAWPVRALAGAGVVAGLVALVAVVGAVLTAMGLSATDHWAWGEVNLWISVLVMLVLTTRTGSEHGRSPQPA